VRISLYLRARQEASFERAVHIMWLVFCKQDDYDSAECEEEAGSADATGLDMVLTQAPREALHELNDMWELASVVHFVGIFGGDLTPTHFRHRAADSPRSSVRGNARVCSGNTPRAVQCATIVVSA